MCVDLCHSNTRTIQAVDQVCMCVDLCHSNTRTIQAVDQVCMCVDLCVTEIQGQSKL